MTDSDFIPITPLTGDPTTKRKPASTKGATDDFEPLGPIGGAEPIGGSDAALYAGKPWYVNTPETVLKYGLGGLGAAGGAAIGSAAGPAGTVVGGGTGWGLGTTTGDIANVGIDKALGYHTTPITEQGVRDDLKENLKGGYFGELATPALGFLGKAVIRGPMAAAEEAAAEHAGATGVAESQAAFEKMHADAATDAMRKVSDAREKELAGGPIRDAAKQEAFTREFKKTPEQAQAARTSAPTQVGTADAPGTEPSPETVDRRMQFRNSIFEPINRSSKYLGAQFEKVFKPYLDKMVDGSGLLETLATEREWAKVHLPNGQYSPAVERVFKELDRDSLHENLTPRETPGPGQEPIPRLMFPTKINHLLAVRSQITGMMARADGPSKAALSVIREGVDDTLGESGVPAAKELRQKYRVFKEGTEPDFYRAMGSGDPVDAMPAIMSDPQRARTIFRAMTPGEKATAKSTFEEWMFKRGAGGEFTNMKSVRPDWAEALGDLGYTGLLAQPNTWAHLNEIVPRASQWMEDTPQAAAKLDAYTDQVRQSEMKGLATKVFKNGLDEADRMGGVTGKRIREAIEAGRTPEEKMKAAMSAFQSLTPESAQAETTAAQQAARVSYLKGESGPYKPSSFMNRMKNWTERYSMLGLLFGPKMFEKAGLFAAIYAPARLMQMGMQYAISRNPEAFLAWYKAVNTLGSDSSYRTLASMAYKGAATAAFQAAGKSDLSEGYRAPSKPEREPFPDVAFPTHEAPDTAFRKALFADRLKTDSTKASSGEMAAFKSSQYKNALIQGIKSAKTPEAAQALAEQMYNRGLVSADDIKSAISGAKDLPIADELKRNTTVSLLKNYKSANEGERDALNVEIERRYEDSPEAFKKKELAPYKHLILKILSERDKAGESASSTP